MSKQQIGVIGLAVMGKNLALNIESRGYSVAVYNRTTAKTEEFLGNEAQGKNFFGATTYRRVCELIGSTTQNYAYGSSRICNRCNDCIFTAIS